MLMLAAIAAAIGLIVLLPPLMILRYVLSWQVLVFLLLSLAFLGAPVLYAWRTRPFSR